MLPTRKTFSYQNIVGAILALTVIVSASAALAQCSPGQMQEATLQYQQAQTFLAAQQWDQAIATLQSAIGTCPEHVEATRGIGDAFMGKEMYAQAVPYYTKVVQLRGDNVEAGDFANLGKAYAQQKMYKEARAEYMKAEQLAPDDCGVLFNLGVLHYASGFHPQSVEVLEHALEVCPQIKDHVLKQLTKSCEQAAAQQKKNGNNERAAYYTDLAKQYGGEAGGSTTYDMVKKKMAAKEYNEAITLLQSMLAKDPTHTGAQLTLARAQDAVGNKTGSIEAYQSYLQLKPNDESATAAMLQVMVESGQCSRAKTEAAAAVRKFEPKGKQTVAPIQYSYGLALECLEEYDAAGAQFAACAASGHPRYTESARRQVERMEGLKAREAAERKKAQQGR